MHFDHSDEKRYAFPHARHIYSLKNYFIGGRCRLAWRVLTQAEENHRREHHKILVKCFKNFVYPWLARRKKKFRTVFQNILLISQFMNCFITARGKSKIETTGVRSSKFQFIQQGVCKFIFPSKFNMGSMFCDNPG